MNRKKNQGKEFFNEMSGEFHLLTGVQQRITSASHPRSNVLVEKQSRNVKKLSCEGIRRKPIEMAIYNCGSAFWQSCQ